MTISIIIPTLNEAANIGHLVRYLAANGEKKINEIIVVDGGSTDDTIACAEKAGAVILRSPKKGRAIQMNLGASVATGNILYFVHADTIPPVSFTKDIEQSVNAGYDLGRYRTRFARKSWKLKFNAFFTRFDMFMCYGGDQTLFVTRELFNKLIGYDENLLIMEEYDFTVRAKSKGRYTILPNAALISTRKYDDNSWWKIQRANYEIVQLYKKGAPQSLMVKRYNELIKYRG